MPPPSFGPGPLPTSVGLFAQEWVRVRGAPAPARLSPWVDALIVDTDLFSALESPAQLHEYRAVSRFDSRRASSNPEDFVPAREALRQLPYRHAIVTPLIDWADEAPELRAVHDGLLVAVPFLAYLRHAPDGRAHGGIQFPLGSDRQSRPLPYSYDDWPAALAALVDLCEASVAPLAVMPVRELLARREFRQEQAREARMAPLRRIADRAWGWSFSSAERRAGGVTADEAVRRLSALVDQLDHELREATGEGIAALVNLEVIGLRQGATALIPSVVAHRSPPYEVSAGDELADLLEPNVSNYARATRLRRNARPAPAAAEPETPPPPPPPDPAARRPEGRARRRIMFDDT